MLYCIYHPSGSKKHVRPNELQSHLSTGIWFESEKEAHQKKMETINEKQHEEKLFDEPKRRSRKKDESRVHDASGC